MEVADAGTDLVNSVPQPTADEALGTEVSDLPKTILDASFIPLPKKTQNGVDGAETELKRLNDNILSGEWHGDPVNTRKVDKNSEFVNGKDKDSHNQEQEVEDDTDKDVLLHTEIINPAEVAVSGSHVNHATDASNVTVSNPVHQEDQVNDNSEFSVQDSIVHANSVNPQELGSEAASELTKGTDNAEAEEAVPTFQDNSQPTSQLKVGTDVEILKDAPEGSLPESSTMLSPIQSAEHNHPQVEIEIVSADSRTHGSSEIKRDNLTTDEDKENRDPTPSIDETTTAVLAVNTLDHSSVVDELSGLTVDVGSTCTTDAPPPVAEVIPGAAEALPVDSPTNVPDATKHSSQKQMDSTDMPTEDAAPRSVSPPEGEHGDTQPTVMDKVLTAAPGVDSSEPPAPIERIDVSSSASVVEDKFPVNIECDVEATAVASPVIKESHVGDVVSRRIEGVTDNATPDEAAVTAESALVEEGTIGDGALNLAPKTAHEEQPTIQISKDGDDVAEAMDFAVKVTSTEVPPEATDIQPEQIEHSKAADEHQPEFVSEDRLAIESQELDDAVSKTEGASGTDAKEDSLPVPEAEPSTDQAKDTSGVSAEEFADSLPPIPKSEPCQNSHPESEEKPVNIQDFAVEHDEGAAVEPEAETKEPDSSVPEPVALAHPSPEEVSAPVLNDVNPPAADIMAPITSDQKDPVKDEHLDTPNVDIAEPHYSATGPAPTDHVADEIMLVPGVEVVTPVEDNISEPEPGVAKEPQQTVVEEAEPSTAPDVLQDGSFEVEDEKPSDTVVEQNDHGTERPGVIEQDADDAVTAPLEGAAIVSAPHVEPKLDTNVSAQENVDQPVTSADVTAPVPEMELSASEPVLAAPEQTDAVKNEHLDATGAHADIDPKEPLLPGPTDHPLGQTTIPASENVDDVVADSTSGSALTIIEESAIEELDPSPPSVAQPEALKKTDEATALPVEHGPTTEQIEILTAEKADSSAESVEQPMALGKKPGDMDMTAEQEIGVEQTENVPSAPSKDTTTTLALHDEEPPTEALEKSPSEGQAIPIAVVKEQLEEPAGESELVAYPRTTTLEEKSLTPDPNVLKDDPAMAEWQEAIPVAEAIPSTDLAEDASTKEVPAAEESATNNPPTKNPESDHEDHAVAEETHSEQTSLAAPADSAEVAAERASDTVDASASVQEFVKQESPIPDTREEPSSAPVAAPVLVGDLQEHQPSAKLPEDHAERRDAGAEKVSAPTEETLAIPGQPVVSDIELGEISAPLATDEADTLQATEHILLDTKDEALVLMDTGNLEETSESPGVAQQVTTTETSPVPNSTFEPQPASVIFEDRSVIDETPNVEVPDISVESHTSENESPAPVVAPVVEQPIAEEPSIPPDDSSSYGQIPTKEPEQAVTGQSLTPLIEGDQAAPEPVVHLMEVAQPPEEAGEPVPEPADFGIAEGITDASTAPLTAVASEIERPKSPWTPSYSVTTLGREAESTTSEPITEQVNADEQDLPKPQLIEPQETLDKPTTEIPRPKSPWASSYSVTSHGSSSPVAAELESEPAQATAASVNTHEASCADEHDTSAADETTSEAKDQVHVDTVAAPTIPDASSTANLELETAPAELLTQESPERPKSPWTPSYSVTTQGSPLVGSTESKITGPTTTSHEGDAKEPTDEPAVAVPEAPQMESDSIPADQPLQEDQLAYDLSEPVAEIPPRLDIAVVATSDEPVPASSLSHSQSTERLSPKDDTPERPRSPWTPSYSVTTQGSPLAVDSEPADKKTIESIDGKHDEELHTSEPSEATLVTHSQETTVDRPKSPWMQSYSVTQHGPASPSPSKDKPAGPLSVAESAVKEATPADLESDVGDVSIITEPATTPKSSLADLVSEAPAGDEAPCSESELMTPMISRSVVFDTPLDQGAVQSAEPHPFPADEDKDRESSKPTVARLAPVEGPSDQTLGTTPTEVKYVRARLESTASSRFFPGGWFSTSPKLEGRTSLEVAQGEFTPSKPTSPIEVAAPATTPVDGDEDEDEERKKRWCVIM